ncbi:transposable element Tcb1 transposase [Trichonephila clavipes]|nr:transposable element Tcb1 transposase [Trichonephila clavipes]
MLAYSKLLHQSPSRHMVAASLGPPVYSRTIRKRLVEGHFESRHTLCVLPLTPTCRRLHLEWCRARGNWTAVQWNIVVFSNESRINLIRDDNRNRVWRARGECLNSAFAIQRHAASTAGVTVWVAIAYNTWSPLVLIRGNITIAYNTWSPLVLIRGNITAKWYVHNILKIPCVGIHATVPSSHFSSRQCLASHRKGLTRMYPYCHYLSLACPIPSFVSNRAYLGSFGMASWIFYEFG